MRIQSFLVGIGILGLSALFVGCATSSTTTTTQTEENKRQSDPKTPSVPTPEQLQGSPCGNPEWAKLPPQHDVSGDVSDDTPADETNTGGDNTPDDRGPSENDDESTDDSETESAPGEQKQPNAAATGSPSTVPCASTS